MHKGWIVDWTFFVVYDMTFVVGWLVGIINKYEKSVELKPTFNLQHKWIYQVNCYHSFLHPTPTTHPRPQKMARKRAWNVNKSWLCDQFSAARFHMLLPLCQSVQYNFTCSSCYVSSCIKVSHAPPICQSVQYSFTCSSHVSVPAVQFHMLLLLQQSQHESFTHSSHMSATEAHFSYIASIHVSHCSTVLHAPPICQFLGFFCARHIIVGRLFK